MKTINKIFIGLGLVGMSGLYSCSDFDEVNTDPSKTPIESTLPEYFLNNAISKIQMDPSTGERYLHQDAHLHLSLLISNDLDQNTDHY